MSRDADHYVLVISTDLNVQDGLKDVVRSAFWPLNAVVNYYLALRKA